MFRFGIVSGANRVFAWLSLGPASAMPNRLTTLGAQTLSGVWLRHHDIRAHPEPGEPSHAGFPATNSLWYSGPSFDGEVT